MIYTSQNLRKKQVNRMKKTISFITLLCLILTLSFNNVYAADDDIIGADIIHKEKNQIFTISQLLNMYESDVFIESDSYTGYGNIPGEYIVTLTQGFNRKDVIIKVVNDWGNLEQSNDVLFISDYKDIHVSNNRILTLYEIIYYLYDTTEYVISDYQFRYEELTDEYHNATLQEDGTIPEGNYNIIFRLTYFSGLQSSYSVNIHVIELEELSGVILEPPPTTIDRVMKAAPFLLVSGLIIYLIKNRKPKNKYNQAY